MVAEPSGEPGRNIVNGPPWHVAHVIGALRTGGAERQLVNYLLAADRREFRHTVLCLTAPGDLAPVVRNRGISVTVLRVRNRTAPLSLYRLRSWLVREQVAVVHTHMHGAALWGRVAGRLAGVPALVTTEHGKELWKNRRQVLVDRFLSRWTCRHIAVSEDGLRIRHRRERVPLEKLVLIPNGVPLPDPPVDAEAGHRVRRELGVPPEAPVLGTVGRLVEAKGYPHLIQALVRLRETHPDAVWLAVGDGPLRDVLAQRVREAGVADAVVFTGRRDDVPDLLAAMDVWVMSSIREGLPVALLEAMAAARPIVATTVGGIPDAVRDGESALLVPAADPAALAAAVGRLLDDPALARRLGAAARRTAEQRYGIETVARRIEAVYRECLAGRGVAPGV